MMDRLFDTEKYYTYNKKGKSLALHTHRIMKILINAINKAEYDIADAENIILAEVSTMFCEYRLTIQAKGRKNNV